MSTEKGTHTNSSLLTSADILYVDFAIENGGTVATTTQFTRELYVDGSLQDFWNGDGLDLEHYRAVEDCPVGPLSAGTHTLTIRIDSTGAIAESNEQDNEYTKTITVVGPTGLCAGDCDSDGQVTIDEILTMVNMAVGTAASNTCAAGDPNGDAECTIDEIVTAVNNALTQCPGG